MDWSTGVDYWTDLLTLRKRMKYDTDIVFEHPV